MLFVVPDEITDMTLHHHRHHAVVLMELLYFLDTLLDQEGEGRHRAERV